MARSPRNARVRAIGAPHRLLAKNRHDSRPSARSFNLLISLYAIMRISATARHIAGETHGPRQTSHHRQAGTPAGTHGRQPAHPADGLRAVHAGRGVPRALRAVHPFDVLDRADEHPGRARGGSARTPVRTAHARRSAAGKAALARIRAQDDERQRGRGSRRGAGAGALRPDGVREAAAAQGAAEPQAAAGRFQGGGDRRRHGRHCGGRQARRGRLQLHPHRKERRFRRHLAGERLSRRGRRHAEPFLFLLLRAEPRLEQLLPQGRGDRALPAGRRREVRAARQGDLQYPRARLRLG